jgi:hypothetical protein
MLTTYYFITPVLSISHRTHHDIGEYDGKIKERALPQQKEKVIESKRNMSFIFS